MLLALSCFWQNFHVVFWSVLDVTKDTAKDLVKAPADDEAKDADF